jgi:glycosyltransferase involved in cell wall biosynthesis
MRGLVSVIVPCFNYGRYLSETVRSLAGQSYAKWECIIVDDGSTDDTPQIGARLSEADSRVRCVRQQNAGLSAARNAGIRLARGEFVQLLDADDVLEPEKLRVQVEFLQQRPEVDIAVGDAAYFDHGSSTGPRPRQSAWPGRAQRHGVLAALVGDNICVVNAALARRSVFDSVGLFDESLPAHEDWDFWVRCAAAGHQFGFISLGNDRALVRQHGESMSTSRDLMFRTHVSVREKMHSLLPAPLARENGQRLSELKWRFGLDLVRAGKVREGWKLYREGLQSAERKASVLLRLLLLVPGVAAAARLNRRIFHS